MMRALLRCRRSNRAIVIWGFLVALLLKLGAAPLHFWFVEISREISWFNFFVLSTLQKILPYRYLLHIVFKGRIIVLVGILVRAAGRLGQANLKKILAYSSLFSLRWILAGIRAYWGIWFLAAYSGALGGAVLSLSRLRATTLSEALCYMQSTTLFLFLVSLLRLAGIPPLLGFFAKVSMLQYLISLSHVILALALAQRSLVFIYIYLSIVLSSIAWVPAQNFIVFKMWTKWEGALIRLILLGAGFLFILHLGV